MRKNQVQLQVVRVSPSLYDYIFMNTTRGQGALPIAAVYLDDRLQQGEVFHIRCRIREYFMLARVVRRYVDYRRDVVLLEIEAIVDTEA